MRKGATCRARSLAAIVAVFAVMVLPACSSGPSYPHAWCGPLITQFRAHETQAAYQAGLESSGAPVGKLIADIGTYEKDEGAAGVPGTASFTALAAEPKALAAVTADLQQLNAECGQAAGAYEGDNT